MGSGFSCCCCILCVDYKHLDLYEKAKENDRKNKIGSLKRQSSKENLLKNADPEAGVGYNMTESPYKNQTPKKSLPLLLPPPQPTA
jgi:hypothetical protein